MPILRISILLAASCAYSASNDPSCGDAETCTLPTGLEDLNIPYIDYLLDTPKLNERPMGAKFRNFRSSDIVMYWDDGSEEGVYSGLIPSMQGSATLSYEGHSFIFYERGPNGERLGRLIKHTMKKGQAIYIIPPDDPETKKTAFYKSTQEEIAFFDKYYSENNTPWLSYYPRGAPILPFHPADYLGQVHNITSQHGYLRCDPATAGGWGWGKSDCGKGVPATLQLKVISIEPRAIFIPKLLSEYEIGHVLELGRKTVARSTVGNGPGSYTSNTRTSSTGWLRRNASPIVDYIFLRFADVLGIDEKLLNHDANAENLQIVHYLEGQQYTPHHDFGDSGRPNTRFLTLFVYIKAAKAGGGTSFPNAYGGRGMKVEPRDGDALLWYNMLPDGNGDELSLHAGMPVQAGEKWGANLWIWDPDFR